MHPHIATQVGVSEMHRLHSPRVAESWMVLVQPLPAHNGLVAHEGLPGEDRGWQWWSSLMASGGLGWVHTQCFAQQVAVFPPWEGDPTSAQGN